MTDSSATDDAADIERLIADCEARLRAKVREARLRAKAASEGDAPEAEHHDALCEAPALLWQADSASTRPAEPFGIIA